MVTLYATSSTNDLAHSGRPRDTTARQDMYIRRQHIYNRLTRATTDNWQPPISDNIVRHRFITNTAGCRCPTGGPILTVRHRQERLQWNTNTSKLASLAVDEYHSPNVLQFHRRYQKQRRNERWYCACIMERNSCEN